MPGEQDILSLGLNIDSFNAEKRKILRDYVSIFDSLQKYDGKIFNPVLGDGLTKFNTSAAETNRLLDEISIKISNLNTNFLRATENGVASFNKTSSAARSYKSATDDASDSLQRFKVNAGGTNIALEGIGAKLTHTLTLLRYMAYILPGLGIAGIFNLAFEAISSAGKAVFDFGDDLDDLVQKQNDVNKSTLEWIANYKELKELVESFESLTGSKFVGGKLDAQIRDQKEYVSLLTAEGIEKGKILENDLKLLKSEQDRAKYNVVGPFGNIENLKKEIDDKINYVSLLSVRIGDINDKIQNKLDYVDPELKRIISGRSDKEKRRDSLQTEFDANSKQLSILESKYKEYYKSIENIKNKEAEISKFNSDQERKLLVENSKNDIAVDLLKQKTILDNDKKFHDEKIEAIKKQYQDEVNLANINRINVTGTQENPNVSATPREIEAAINKQTDDITNARIKRDKEIEKIDVEFYQRKIAALTSINKDEIEKDAIANEKIYLNQEKSLKERLDAYNKYIEDKQKIKDYEFGKDIQKAAARPGGLTSLTPEEKQQLETHRDVEKANIAANGEKQVYDIVYTSLRKIIKDTQDSIKEEEDLSKQGYTRALHDLNESYDNKKISLRRYKEERKRIDNKYEKEELDQQIDRDQKDLIRLENVYLGKILLELNYREKLLEAAKKGGNQLEIDKAQGAVDAADQARVDISKDIKEAKDRLTSDKLKREKIGPTDKNKLRDDWIDAVVKVEEKVTDSLQKLHDDRIQREEQFVERRKQLLDEQYGYEQDAIEKSSLNAKDKLAYDIQIQAQKQALDRNAEVEERNLKIQQFNFNKKLQLANAAVNIAAAVIKDGLTTPKSIADAVIGAAEIATILATQPPAFAEGVFNFEGGVAKYGEAGPELIKVPGKDPFIAFKETVSYLPKGTDVIPLREDYPVFDNKIKDNSWEQTRFLAKQIKSSNKEIKNIFKPTIIVDMAFENRKRQILGN